MGRGLIISRPMKVVAKDRRVDFGDEPPVDPQLLRCWLLYWDKLLVGWPDMISPSLGQDCDFLLGSGKLEFHLIPTNGDMCGLVVKARQEALAECEAREPGCWAVATGPGTWEQLDEENSDGMRALQMKLVQALPVPAQDVPLDEILAFADRRKDERDAILAIIDEVYLSVLQAPDRPLAENAAIARLARGARDQIDVAMESRLPFRLMDIAADFNLAAGVLAGAGSVAFGASWPAIVGNSLVAGASLTIGQVLGLTNPKRHPTAYRYIVSYHNELFRPETLQSD